MLFATICVLIGAFAAYSIRWRLKILKTFKELNIPGPVPSFFWGNLVEIQRNGHMVMQKRWHQQYGPVVGYFFGMHPVILISDIGLLKKIQHKDFHSFVDRPEIVNGGSGGVINNSLIVLKGQRWKEVRSTLTPSFTSKKLKEIAPEVCINNDEFMKNVDTDFANSAECNIMLLYQALTLDTICKSGMGVDFGVQKEAGNSKILEQSKHMFSVRFNFIFMVIFSFPILLDTATNLISALVFRVQTAGHNPLIFMKQKCSEIVQLRRSNPEKSQRVDLLQLMMDAKIKKSSAVNFSSLIAGDEAEDAVENGENTKSEETSTECPFAEKPGGLTHGEIIDNALLLLLAGFETTSSTLGFITKMLLRYPEVQERVREELLEATDQGKVFDIERLQRCQYTEAVVQETLRMYPPIYFFQARLAAEDVTYGSLRIPKGIGVFVSVPELHYNEEVFNNAHEFQPDRFLPENKTAEMANSWQPFGAGPRNCIGMRFAQMEIKITLARLLTKYRISSEKEPKHNPLIKTMVKPLLQQLDEPLTCKLELI